jgi:hypothetical protein
MRRAVEWSLTKTIAKANKKREEEKRWLVEAKAAEEQVVTEKRDEEKKREKEKRTKKMWRGWRLGMIRRARGTLPEEHCSGNKPGWQGRGRGRTVNRLSGGWCLSREEKIKAILPRGHSRDQIGTVNGGQGINPHLTSFAQPCA